MTHYSAAQYREAVRPKGVNKYGAQKVIIGDRKFDSKAEGRHYALLLVRERAGEISDLQCQVIYRLAVNGLDQKGTRPPKYIADFTYAEDGKEVVVDVKGGKATKTASYRIKKYLMLAIHGISIVEVG